MNTTHAESFDDHAPRVLAASHARRVAWKNGLGTTLEIATDATHFDAPWLWRLAIADVPKTAAFSQYLRIDRAILLLDGAGLALIRDGVSMRVPDRGSALEFAGEEECIGVPTGVGVRDINLMMQRDHWRGSLELIAATHETRGDCVVVHAIDKAASITMHGRTAITLARGETFIGAGVVRIECQVHARAAIASLIRK